MANIDTLLTVKEDIRQAINTLNGSEVVTNSMPFNTWADYVIIPKPKYKTYTVKIDLNNSDPESSVSYMNDAVGMNPGYDNWKNTNIIKSIKPCVLSADGTVKYYLQKDDYTKKEDGSTSILTGADGDIMVEIPKIGYRLWNDENYQYVSVTEDPAKADYCYYAHSLEAAGDCDKIYYGAYLGYTNSNNLYSRSGVSPTANINLINFRTYASNRGTGYSLESFFPRTLLQCLYVIIYKNLNSQAALGQGYTDSNNSAKTNTGITNINTFCYGDPNDGTKHVKFLGIEDFYGNLLSQLDGIYSDTSDLLTDYRNSQMINDGHDFQFSTPKGTSSSYGGYIDKIMGTNTSGFTKDYNNGSNGTSSTYFADNGGGIALGRFGRCGSSWESGAAAGAFCLYLNFTASMSFESIGARLIYKHLSS